MKRFMAIMVWGLVAVLALNTASAQEAKKEKEKTFEADKGVATVDVSKYPKEMQENYKEFEKRCSKCHTLARPINSSYAGDEWGRYVQRMSRKAGSGINPKNGQKIIDFLVYYSEVKKKDKAAEK